MLNIKLYIYIILLIYPYSLEAAPQCDHWIARLVSAKGRVEKQNRNQSKWQQVSQYEFFCQGDKIRTLKHSRVILKFIHEPSTIVQLEQNSALTFPKIEKDPVLPFNLPKGGVLLVTQAINTFKLLFLFINTA